MTKVSSANGIFWRLFLTAVAALCLLGAPLSFDVGGINTSVLELAAFPVFLAATMGFLVPRTSVNRAFLLLIFVSIFPLLIGLFEGRGLSHILREFAPLIYTGFLFVGALFRRNGYIGGEKLLKLVCWTASIYAALYILENRLFDTGIITHFWPHWRLVTALGVLALLGRLFGLPGAPRFPMPLVLAMLAAMIAYAMEIRTRALPLMIFLGALFLFFGLLKQQRTAGKFVRVFVIGLFGSLAIYLAGVMVMEDASLKSHDSFRRLVVLLSGSGFDVTAIWRLETWRIAWGEAIRSPIFGVGFGSYLLLDPLIRGEYSMLPSVMIHNIWLHLFYSGGLVYLSGYLYLFYRIYKSIGESAAAGAPQDAGVALVARAFLIGYCVYIAFGTGFFSVNSAALLWFLLGFFSGAPQRRLPVQTQAPHLFSSTTGARRALGGGRI